MAPLDRLVYLLLAPWTRKGSLAIMPSFSVMENPTMKVTIAALVLTGVLCATAPAWSDTLSGHSRDSAVVHAWDSGEFDLHNAQPPTLLLSSLVESGKFELIDLQPEHRLWEGRYRHRLDSGDPLSTTTPVAAPEPSTLELLALGLVGLLGSALLASRPRPRMF